MRILKTKNITKQIICIILVMMICNFIIPNTTYAADTNSGGDIFDRIVKFVTFLCDSVMQFLQNSFTSNASIANGNGTFTYQYSPAVIFSGEVQGLDINFIVPNEDERNTVNYGNYEPFFRTIMDDYIEEVAYEEKYSMDSTDFGNKLYTASHKDGIECVEKDFSTSYGEENDETWANIYYYQIDNMLYAEFFYYDYDQLYDEADCYYNTYDYNINDREDLKQMNAATSYTSIAFELQPTIASWYNALRRIALVGLLSVLVYTGIRVVLSSGTKDSSKYKKMLTDWLIALCLLFTLHYIMNITLVVTQKISSIFNDGSQDTLLATLRETIERVRLLGRSTFYSYNVCNINNIYSYFYNTVFKKGNKYGIFNHDSTTNYINISYR